MKTDKQIKKEFKLDASKNPDNYYATGILKKEGFIRKHCSCGTYFWTVNKNQEVCGDSDCSGGFRLFEKNPCTKKLDYIAVWNNFSKMFQEKGYQKMDRYPVVARWNPTMDFTIASIAAFQPYVVSGEVQAPAKKLVIPQFCLRFGDVDNVGITMSHMTGFVMIGQHMFVEPKEWSQEQAFSDIMDWIFQGLGLPKEEVTFHEDAWAGGGNYGPCMEFFSRGVELGNQVYMLYEQTPDGSQELKLKVLDMGMGMERNAWFSQGKGTIYDATFPTVMDFLAKKTQVVRDEKFLQQYIPHAAFLNIDEVEDMSEAWDRVAKAMKMDAKDVRERIEPVTALCAIAEHARSLLLALADGGLPSNTGGGYNLRVIYRRAQGFIERFGWNVDIADVCFEHAKYLETIFPELLASMPDVRKILAVEFRKYQENKKKNASIIEQLLKKQDAKEENTKENEKGVSVEKLIELYDSNGIDPETIRRAAKEKGILIKVPDNFYQLVSERHEQQEQKTATNKKTFYPVSDLAKTSILYYGLHDAVVFSGTVLKVFDENKVVLDKTAFYPTSGGQEHDTGKLQGEEVIDVIKQDGVIIHIVKNKTSLREGSEVTGTINLTRRQQLAQHHTTTHIINGAAKKVLGNHVWQAGAAKTEQKARIDITHYDALTDAELAAIEKEANNIVKQNIAITKDLVAKDVAEKEHGFRLYQGGAVPGSEIRVVNISGFDVEACGGTHLENTAQAGLIKILKSTKVQDGIVRIEFVSGKAAEAIIAQETTLLSDIMSELSCEEEEIPARCEELFGLWKKARKGALEQFSLQSHERFEGDSLVEAARILKTQPEHVLKTIQRFKSEIKQKEPKFS